MRLPHIRQFLVAIALQAICVVPVQAELRALAPVVDLGVIRGGQKAAHRFELVNFGTEPVEILDLKRGCGCLVPRLGERTLPPGAKTTLALELRTLGQADGPHTWNLEVQYRIGSDAKSLTLGLRGTVRSDITVQPAILGLYVTKTVQQEITLTDTRAMPLRVVDVEARAPGVQVIKIDRAGKTTTILVAADATKLAPGRHEGLLSITTDDAEYGQLHVPIVVTKTAETVVRPTPEKVELRVSSSTASALVRLRSTNDQAVRIEKIVPSDPALVCTWAPGPGNDATLKIQVQATRLTRGLEGHVEVYLSAPAAEVLTIPVRVVGDMTPSR